MSGDRLTLARWLVQRGMSVIPLDHPDATLETDPKRVGKAPRLPTWKQFQRAHPTSKHLDAWFGNGTPRNLGIVTGAISNLVMIDGDSAEALAWMRAHLPPTEMGSRTSSGEHWYYQHPGIHIRNKARLLIDGSRLKIDVRGDGGYAIAPTSKHRTGIIYAQLGTWPPYSASSPCSTQHGWASRQHRRPSRPGRYPTPRGRIAITCSTASAATSPRPLAPSRAKVAMSTRSSWPAGL